MYVHAFKTNESMRRGGDKDSEISFPYYVDDNDDDDGGDVVFFRYIS